MIVPMKKVTLLTSLKHREATLVQLRKLGVLHIQDVKAPMSEDIQVLETRLDNVERALQILPQVEATPANIALEQAPALVEQVLSLNQQKDGLNRELAEYQDHAKWFAAWGDISSQSMQKLKAAGIFVRLYLADKSYLKRLPAEKMIHLEKEVNGALYLALFGQNPDDKLDLKEEQVPQVEPAEVRSKISQLELAINDINQKLNDLAGVRTGLVALKNDLTKRLTLNRVKYGMGEAAGLAYIQGFCPAHTVTEIKNTADQEGWGYIVEDPSDPYEVPTLIKNPKWIRIVQPILNFMGTLPGYNEQDVSLVFLSFITIFFAMIVGDGGYGLTFLILTILLASKNKNASREFINLMYLFSIATMIWGLITGNWFGVQAIGKLPGLRNFVIPQLDAFSPASTPMIMQISFIIGVTHLTIARLLSAYRNRRTVNALADIGYIIVLWAVFFVANNLILKKPLPGITPTLLVVGIVMIALFANFQKNVVKGILITMGSLPFGVIGAFADIVSYIRLFAVGLASYIVASSFNTLAIGKGIDNVLSGVMAAIILFLAHALNIVLSGMSVLVHGVRLNMLEFSNHVGIQWAGKPYKPFKE